MKKEVKIMNAVDQKYVEKVLKSYEEKKTTKIDELRALDKKATLGANIFAYTFGSIGSLVLGFGMCVAMQVILANLIWIGIVVGIFMVSINYFIYKALLAKGKAKYGEEIIQISNELLENK